MKRFICLVIVLLAGFYLYARYIGVNGLQVYEYNIESEKIPNEFNGFSIIHFSDLLYGGTIDLEDVNNLVNKINEYTPSVVVFSGDLIKTDYTLNEEDKEKMIEYFNNINVEQKKYAIIGDSDLHNKDLVVEILNKSNFIILENSNELIFNKSNSPIMLSGITDFTNIDKSFANEIESVFNIALIHESDYADKLIDYNADVILAGNSLGGLVKIPFLGGILKQSNSSKYLDGKYEINDKSSLFVSSGLGTDKYPYRAFNTPSFNIYRLYNKAN